MLSDADDLFPLTPSFSGRTIVITFSKRGCDWGAVTPLTSYALGYVMVFGSQVYLKATLLWQWMLKTSSDTWALIPDVQMLDSGGNQSLSRSNRSERDLS